MSIFQKMTTDNLEKTEDRLGGGFEAIPSAVYDAVIKNMYVTESASSNAQAITVIADAGGKEVRDTIWFTNKNGENFYLDKDDKTKKVPMLGFTTIDDICLLTTEAPMAEQATEEKMVKMYDATQKKELPKATQVLINCIGKPIKLAILRQIEDKQKKNDAGVYVNTGETRTVNTIDKPFHHETGRTVNEYRHEVETSEFMDAWVAKNTGNDRNRAKGVAAGGSTAGSSGSGRPGGDSPAKKNLFGNK